MQDVPEPGLERGNSLSCAVDPHDILGCFLKHVLVLSVDALEDTVGSRVREERTLDGRLHGREGGRLPDRLTPRARDHAARAVFAPAIVTRQAHPCLFSSAIHFQFSYLSPVWRRCV